MKVLHAVDTWQKRMDDEPARGPVQAAGTFYEKAYSLVTAPEAKKAFDIHSEDPRLRDRYGRNSLGPGLPAGPAVDRGGRSLCHGHRRRLGYAPGQLQGDENAAAAQARRGGLGPGAGPVRPWHAGADAGGGLE